MDQRSPRPEAADLRSSAAGWTPSVELSHVAAQVVRDHRAAPCAVVAAALHGCRGWRYGLGVAGRVDSSADAPVASAHTLFDLASLTKPLVALSLARLARAGTLGWREPLGALLGELGHTASGPATLELLAAHRAGLEAHREFFVRRAAAAQLRPDAVMLLAAEARRPGCEGPPPAAGFPAVYSDLGYLLLGAALSARSGFPLDELVARQLARPLGLRLGSVRELRAAAPDPAAFLATVAPTEQVPWRGGLVHGIVHDENAWVVAGEGMAGHAGAFGDARSVLALGVALVDALAERTAAWLTAAELAPLVRGRPGGSHGVGFDRRSGPAPSSGRHFGPETFGHLGFTGTSLWIDPSRQLVGVLLTNRVHPTRDNEAIRHARPAVYDGLFEAMARG